MNRVSKTTVCVKNNVQNISLGFEVDDYLECFEINIIESDYLFGIGTKDGDEYIVDVASRDELTLKDGVCIRIPRGDLTFIITAILADDFLYFMCETN